MKQIDIEVSTTISMTYDPESEEFKSALESYRDAIEDGASEEDMLRQIAWYITAFGTENMIGVREFGYGKNHIRTPYFSS